GTAMWPTCPGCGHTVDYMDNPQQVPRTLPDIIIATPDKLFYEATARGFEWASFGLFGAPVRRCLTCRRAIASSFLALKPRERCSDVAMHNGCTGTIATESEVKPIRYMGFDEVHSLYGEEATYLSIFLATLQTMQ